MGEFEVFKGFALTRERRLRIWVIEYFGNPQSKLGKCGLPFEGMLQVDPVIGRCQEERFTASIELSLIVALNKKTFASARGLAARPKSRDARRQIEGAFCRDDRSWTKSMPNPSTESPARKIERKGMVIFQGQVFFSLVA